MVTHQPLRRSGRAALPRPATAPADDAKAAQRIGRAHARNGNAAVDQAPQTVPADVGFVAAPRQHFAGPTRRTRKNTDDNLVNVRFKTLYVHKSQDYGRGLLGSGAILLQHAGEWIVRPAAFIHYDILRRWLHCGIALSILLCLTLATVMTARPGANEVTLAAVALTLHKFIGLNALLLITIYLLWAALGHAKSLAELYPWGSLERLREIASELVAVERWHNMRAVPSAVQGLGLLVALSATLTGLALVLGVIHPPLLLGQERLITALHCISANLLWGYCAVHAGATLLHRLRGERGVLAIFALLRPE